MNKATIAAFELIETTERTITRNRIMYVMMIVLHAFMFTYLFILQWNLVFMFQDQPAYAALYLSILYPIVLFLAAALTFQVFRAIREWRGKPEHLAILDIKRRIEALEAQNQTNN